MGREVCLSAWVLVLCTMRAGGVGRGCEVEEAIIAPSSNVFSYASADRAEDGTLICGSRC